MPVAPQRCRRLRRHARRDIRARLPTQRGLARWLSAGLWAVLHPTLRESILGPVPGDYSKFLLVSWTREYPPFWAPDDRSPQPYTWFRARVLHALYPADRTMLMRMKKMAMMRATMFMRVMLMQKTMGLMTVSAMRNDPDGAADDDGGDGADGGDEVGGWVVEGGMILMVERE